MQCKKSLALAAAIFVASACAAAVIPSAAHAVKGHCEGDTHWQCSIYSTSKENGAWYDSKTGQWYNKSCGCREDRGSNGAAGDYGHAEIHKKNVPTVKPSGAGPTNLARPPLGLAPHAPMRGAPPAAFQPGRAF
jgi:hypothetical protein